MASPKKKPRRKRAKKAPRRERAARWLFRWLGRGALAVFGLAFVAVVFFAVFNPTLTPYMLQERARLGEIKRGWVNVEEVSPVMLRAVVAAEDANFCNHWGFDMQAIRAAMNDGAMRGASTLTQQTVKNVFLWQGRSWLRKAIEAFLTPMVELVWTKRRIVEVYLNVAEFDEGVFGVRAGARHYFGVAPDKISATQAARLAAVLPSPKVRSARRPSELVSRRTAAIVDGAATIRHDGRAACFDR